MSAPQWIALAFCVVVCAGALAGMWHELWLDGERRIRDAYRGSNVAYDDAEVARLVAEGEREIDDWLQLARAVGVLPLEPTPIHDRLVCEYIEQAEGWAS